MGSSSDYAVLAVKDTDLISEKRMPGSRGSDLREPGLAPPFCACDLDKVGTLRSVPLDCF